MYLVLCSLLSRYEYVVVHTSHNLAASTSDDGTNNTTPFVLPSGSSGDNYSHLSPQD
ncbi:MAG TPA: hypothetical protein VFI73_01625 [Candidatus Nitrosopolaris sp.]|nr:hypothetical protein [Candidatus Nitrosopolaris sp.]